MPFGIEIYISFGRYFSFTMADDTIYDLMQETLSSPKGQQLYGMVHVAGRKGIPDAQIDTASPRLRSLVVRLNGGEALDLEAELDACFDSR